MNDLYLDFNKKPGHGRKGWKRNHRRGSKKPLIIGLIILIIIAAAAAVGIHFFRQYRAQKAEEARQRALEKQIVDVTFPEGYSVDMMAKHLEDENIFKADDFIAAVKDTSKYTNSWIKDLPKKDGVKYQLEGFLYPDTYEIYRNADPEDLVQKMLDNFEQKYQAMAKNYKGKRSMYDIVTIASIVEREAAVASERPTIAGVIENRLAKKMRLQMCPTVLYVTTDGMYDANKVYYKDLKVKSPYNTYRNSGLPVGAICNPGNESLSAAMNPQKNDYLYYHTDGNKKTHIFTKTYQEHQDTRIITDDKS